MVQALFQTVLDCQQCRQGQQQALQNYHREIQKHHQMIEDHYRMLDERKEERLHHQERK